MKNNIKLIGIMTIVGVISFTSCKKDSLSQTDPISMEIGTEEPSLRLSTSDYEMTTTNPLGNTNGSDYYTQGTIEYKINNQLVATVDFGDGTANEKAILTKDGVSSEFELKKKKEGSKYKKVIVKPLVKTDDCNYIVEGTIKYYEIATGAWAATIDYGNGTCDEWATKTWPAGSYGDKSWNAGSKTFSLDDWKKDGKK